MKKRKKRITVPVIMQMETLECGAASLAMILAYHGKWLPLEQVRSDCGVSRDGSKASNIAKAGRSYGLEVKAHRYGVDEVKENVTYPAIIHWNFNHFVVLCGFTKNAAVINDPARGTIKVTMEEFDHSFTGVCIEFTPGENFEKGGKLAYVTLHVGLGTFRPVKVDDVLEHHMHSEYYQVTQEAAELINQTKENGGRVICVGTTSCRTVESAADENGRLEECCGNTEIFIYPGYRFKVLDCLITNFHLPESTLVMLVSALAGREHVLAAYEEAVREKYRFFSFGDACFFTDTLQKQDL